MDEVVTVQLDWTYGKRHPRTQRVTYFGPGRVTVPKWYADALGLKPVEDEPQEEAAESVTNTIQGVEVEISHSDDLTQLKGVSVELADALYGVGFVTFTRLANAQVEELTPIQGIGEKKAQSIKEQARELAGGDS